MQRGKSTEAILPLRAFGQPDKFELWKLGPQNIDPQGTQGKSKTQVYYFCDTNTHHLYHPENLKL